MAEKVPETPGRHALRLVLGDAEHEISSPALVSRKITVTVY
jgi:hypothetical protein